MKKELASKLASSVRQAKANQAKQTNDETAKPAVSDTSMTKPEPETVPETVQPIIASKRVWPD